MGLRCLIGHDYGDLLTSSDQQDRGNEVVVTVREYRECARCGYQRIITENKEIKAGATAGPAADASTEPDETSDDQTADASADDEAWGGADNRSGVGDSRLGGDPVEPMTAEEDDGVILEEEPERPTRARGEWPDDGRDAAGDGPAADDAVPEDAGPEDGEPGGSLPQEEQDSSPAGASTDATAAAGDGEIIDAEAVGDAGRTAPTGPGGSGSPADGPSSAADAPRERPDDGEAEFLCPECGETWPAVNASLRPGDICPQCHRGYLSEQVVQ